MRMRLEVPPLRMFQESVKAVLSSISGVATTLMRMVGGCGTLLLHPLMGLRLEELGHIIGDGCCLFEEDVEWTAAWGQVHRGDLDLSRSLASSKK